MKIARMFSPVYALGPGRRVALWTQGCGRRCPGCISPELHPDMGEDLDEALLADILIKTAGIHACRGLTVSGGDPFEQAQALERLLFHVRDRFEDILVYTGFLLEEISGGSCGRAGKACLDRIDVLIDGPYLERRNHPDCVLRGSDNQRIHFLNPRLEDSYAAYMEQGRILESFSHGGSVILAGIPDRRDDT